MAEVTLRDICRWDRRLELVTPPGRDPDDVLDRGVSWVVSVRASAPLLPPLRGDEIVVLPRRVVDEIEHSQVMSIEELLATLAGEPIAALLVESTFTDEPIRSLPILTLPAPFPHDAEGTLNRLITERRAELYRLGNDLSRRLSQAAIDPQGVESLLKTGAEVSGRTLVLQDAEGGLIATAGAGQPVPAGTSEIDVARNSSDAALVSEQGNRERLIIALTHGAANAVLSMIAPTGTLNEVDRLVLTQTAGTIEIVLGHRVVPGARQARQQAIAELLRGELGSPVEMTARARGLGINHISELAVGLVWSEADPAERTVERILGGIAGIERADLGDTTAFIVPVDALDELERRIHRFQSSPSAEATRIALSELVHSVTAAPDAFRQARFAIALQKTGAIDLPVVRCGRLEEIGLYGLLFHLWESPAVDEFQERVLGDLERYDRRRGSNLIQTLDAYLESGASVTEASKRLNVHRNTMAYRIGRIADVTGRDLGDPRERLLLRMALYCRQLVNISGTDSAGRAGTGA